MIKNLFALTYKKIVLKLQGWVCFNYFLFSFLLKRDIMIKTVFVLFKGIFFFEIKKVD